jgi:hypothetical protein
VCTLRTGAQCPSLNLSHAVGVVLHRLFEPRTEPSPRGAAPGTAATAVEGASAATAGGVAAAAEGPAAAAPDAAIDGLLTDLRAMLCAVGHPTGPDQLTRRERTHSRLAYRLSKQLAAVTHVVQRSRATAAELDALRAVFRLLATPPTGFVASGPAAPRPSNPTDPTGSDGHE